MPQEQHILSSNLKSRVRLKSLWRQNGRDGVSNHQPHDCLLNRLFRRRSKKTPKLCVTGLCTGYSPLTGEFPAQKASNAVNVSIWWRHRSWTTVYPKKYAHGFCFAVLCCGYTLTDFPISIRLTSLALWQSNDCPSTSKATLMNMDKYFMWIHYERLRNHNKAKHNKTVCIFLGIYCKSARPVPLGALPTNFHTLCL